MRIIALFNLKPGVDPEAYESWAQSRDLPGIRSLASIGDFDIYRTTGLLFSGDPAPFDYIEVLDVVDMEGLDKDLASDAVEALTAELRDFTDNAIYIKTERLSVV